MAKLATGELSRVAKPVDKIILARKFPELESWLWDAFHNACTSEYAARFSLKDWQRLDKSDVIIVAMGQEAYRSKGRNFDDQALTSLMKKTFGLRPP